MIDFMEAMYESLRIPQPGTLTALDRFARIAATATQRLPLPVICAVLDITPRTLHAACRERFGLSPGTYLRRCRLASAHDALRAGRYRSVTAVAISFGFDDFGQCGRLYRRRCGEPPSDTLKRARCSSIPRIAGPPPPPPPGGGTRRAEDQPP